MNLRGRVGIVTGADTDAGRSAASALAAEGMSLMLVVQPGVRLHGVAEELAARHDVRCFAASADVADPAAVDRVLMHVEQHLGPIDAVVSTVPGRLVDATLPDMSARGRGHIVHVPPSEAGPVPPQVTVHVVDAADAAGVADLIRGQ